jgi:hypothetical protein
LNAPYFLPSPFLLRSRESVLRTGAVVVAKGLSSLAERALAVVRVCLRS